MKQYQVTGMSCAACSARVEKAVRSVPGVTGCAVSLLTNSMGVEGEADEKAVIRAVEKAGYGAFVKGKNVSPAETADTDALTDRETPRLKRRLLVSLGFEIEPFGAADYAIRSLPDDMDIGDAASAVEEICEKLRRGDSISAENARDEILHTVACKAAIKAGHRHETAELQRIADAVLAGEVKYCPHGRPVSVRLTKNELDKFFSRIV